MEQRIKELRINPKERFDGFIISLILEKAVDDPLFTPTYAIMSLLHRTSLETESLCGKDVGLELKGRREASWT